jgi:hypothetical protein
VNDPPDPDCPVNFQEPLNYVIFLVEFTDGSTVTDELRHLRRELEPIEAVKAVAKQRERRLQQRLDELQEPPQVEFSDSKPVEPSTVVEMDAGKRDSQSA